MKIFVAYLIVLHVFAAALFFRSDTFESWVDQGPNDHIKRMRSIHRSIDPMVPDGASIFLGDSITQRLAVASVTSKAVNFGIGTQTSSELIESIREYESLKRAKRIYLLIGINDFVKDEAHGIQARLKTISEILPDNVPVFWSGIMPVPANPELIHDINRANAYIKIICDKKQFCTYIDTHNILNPFRSSAFTDGLHLSTLGYKFWIQGLKMPKRD